MLQATATVRTQMQDESVIVVGNDAEHSGFGFDNLLHVSLHPFRIVIAFAVDHDAMGHAAHFEFDFGEVAYFERRVVKNIEVLSAKSVRLTGNGRQPGSDLPTRWCDYPQSRRGADTSIRIHQERSVVPERVIRIQFIRAHGKFVGIDAIEDSPLTRVARLDAPR